METKDIDRFAHLARIELSPEFKGRLENELDEILSYVERVETIVGDAKHALGTPLHRNVLREDAEPHEGGVYTKALLDAAPHQKGQHIAVKKIIDNG